MSAANLTAAELEVIDFLHRVADVDPHAHLLLTHGRLFTPPSPAPAPAAPERRGNCYQTAHQLADDTHFYTEGLAHTGTVPLQHAWLSTQDGSAVDPTWADDPGTAYVGLPFTYQFVAEHTWRTGLYSILEGDIRSDWRLARYGLPEHALASAGQPVAQIEDET